MSWTREDNKGLRRQSRILGVGRTHVGAGLEPRVRRWVEATARRKGCTRQVVMSVAIAHFANIKIDDTL